MSRYALRAWQEDALQRWAAAGCRGIVSVVTGGGKTIFALSCIAHIRAETTLVVVPTIALLDQWWEETANFFDLSLDEIHVMTKRSRLRVGTINLAVLNTAAAVAQQDSVRTCFLVIDECHKAASAKFRAVLDIPTTATLGLSATPERPYDSGLNDVLVPQLGPVIYEYTYKDAQRDGVIVPFRLNNVVFDLEDERETEYRKLTGAIARVIKTFGADSDEAIKLMLRRSRVLNLSLNRVRLALRLVAAHRGRRILIFHEDIDACNLIHEALSQNDVTAGLYHSKVPLRERVLMLAKYRRGEVDVLVTCRALDEGFNVPETEIGIIAASTATRRQRIQRLGRVLRPAKAKDVAVIYTLVATAPEIHRLQDEERSLEGVAKVTWIKA